MVSGGRPFVLLDTSQGHALVLSHHDRRLISHRTGDDSKLYESLEVVVDAWGCEQYGVVYIKLELTHYEHGHFDYCELVPFSCITATSTVCVRAADKMQC